MPKVSIIVPVYNQEKYLKDCLNSVLQQSFADYEVLLINDGSTDSSATICDEFATADLRFKVFHKNNEGVSIARNIGIKKSTGDYLIFLDADDFWIDTHLLKQMILLAEKNNADIIRGDYIPVNKNKEPLSWHKLPTERSSLNGRIISLDFFINELINGEYFLWLCLIKSSIIKINKIYLTPGRVYLEDKEFYLALFPFINKIIYYHSAFYAYRKIYGETASSCKSLHNKRKENLIQTIKCMYNKYTIYKNQRKIKLYWSLYADLIKDFYNSISSGGYGNPFTILKESKIRKESIAFFNKKGEKIPFILRVNPYIYISFHVVRLTILKRLWKIKFVIKNNL